jgi:signal transduction histidine kinase
VPASSLVLKIYLFAVAALISLGALVMFGSRFLVDEGRLQALREVGINQAGLIAREVESSLAGERPDPERLRRLGQAMGARVAFVAWKPALRAWPDLASESISTEPIRRRGARAAWRYWVRVDRSGNPIGALRVEFRRPAAFRGPPPHRSWVGAVVAIGVVALITIPPLIFWVLMPLRRMVAVANRLGDGKLDEPVTIDRRDEFGRLERAFETLRVRILQMLHQRDRLLTDISHELRGPLSRMAIALPLVKAGIGDHPSSGYLQQLEQDVSKMDDLIGELLAYARGKSPQGRKDEAIDLAEVARALQADRAVVIDQRSVALDSRLSPAPVRGDARLLSRAMGNLLDNALKFAGASGTVVIATAVEAGDAVFRVQDDGPGIPAADLPHIFEPFYRPDTARTREAGGTGLGLAIVQAVAESHGGKASLRPGSERGTIAELRLPAAEA